MLRNKLQYSGFTLIEILIALMIFAIIAVLCGRLLFVIVNAREDLQLRSRTFTDLQIAVALWQRDCSQIIDRPIIDNSGNPMPALILNTYPNHYFEFTHGTLQASTKMTMLQRVAYFVQGKQLIRETWPVLDRASNSKPLQQVILKNVSDFSVKILDNHDKWQTTWPLYNVSTAQPRAIAVKICFVKTGCLQNVTAILAENSNAR